jgi:hypothetical protein
VIAVAVDSDQSRNHNSACKYNNICRRKILAVIISMLLAFGTVLTGVDLSIRDRPVDFEIHADKSNITTLKLFPVSEDMEASLFVFDNNLLLNICKKSIQRCILLNYDDYDALQLKWQNIACYMNNTQCEVDFQ